MTADAFPPGLTPEVVERCGHLVRQAAGRAFIEKPLNPYELEAVANALLGITPRRPSEFHDTSQPVDGEPQRLGETEAFRDLEVVTAVHAGVPPGVTPIDLNAGRRLRDQGWLGGPGD